MSEESFNLLLFLLSVAPVVYLSIIWHECGHALAGRVCGFRISSFGLGVGRPFLVLSWGNTRFYLCRRNLLQGITFTVSPRLFPGRLPALAMIAGGALAQAFLAAVALVAWRLLPWGTAVWVWTGVYNALSVVIALTPRTFRVGPVTLRTDGAWIVHLLRGGEFAPPAPSRIQMVRAFRELWQATGDVVSLHANLLVAASAWLELGNAARAEELHAEAEALSLSLTPLEHGLRALVRGELAARASRFDEAAGTFDEAEQTFRASDDAGGLFAVALGRAGLRVRQGNPVGALEELALLESHPILSTVAGLRADLVADRLCLAEESDSDVERFNAEYETLRRRHPSDLRDLRVSQARGRWHARHEEWAAAGMNYRCALEAAQRLHELFTDPTDRAAFLDGQAGLLAEAGDCLRQAGRIEEAEQIPALFVSCEESKRRRAAEAERRDRRRLRLGWLLLVLNFVLGVAILAADVLASRPGQARRRNSVGDAAFLRTLPEPWETLAYTLVVFNAVQAACALLWLLASLAVPTLRRVRGALTLYLAVLPWVPCLLGLVAAFRRAG